MSSSAGGVLPSTFGHPVTEKLTKSNYAFWKLLVLHAIHGAQLVGYIDGSSVAPPQEITTETSTDTKKESNPAYSGWLALDQQVFSYIVASSPRTS
jgi:hypothetical protein